jgi:hypothetical protein
MRRIWDVRLQAEGYEQPLEGFEITYDESGLGKAFQYGDRWWHPSHTLFEQDPKHPERGEREWLVCVEAEGPPRDG